MKEVFQMLKDPRFHLVYGVTQRYSNGPEPRRVRLNREGYKLVEGVTKKALVYPRMRLAVHPSPLKGDAFSPIFGRITDVTERSLFVEAIEPDEALRALADGVEKVDLINDERTGQELAVLLKSLGLNTKSLGQQCETLIINGLNPDPGVTWAEPMLLTHQGTLRAGLAVLRRLSPAKRILLAVPREMHLHFDDVEVVRVTARYPASVDALLVKSVTGKEKPEGVGVVGAKLLYADGTVQHAGVGVGLLGAAAHLFTSLPPDAGGYFDRARLPQNLSAVTGACQLVRRDVYGRVGGYTEDFTVGYNDVDFCLKTIRAGYRVVCTPYARMNHYEFSSRGRDMRGERMKRVQKETDLLRSRWSEFFEGSDPYLNPNLSKDSCYFALRKG